jgi:hypothetical protein
VMWRPMVDSIEVQLSSCLYHVTREVLVPSIVFTVLGAPVVSTRPLLRSNVPLCSPHVPCRSGAPDQVSDDEAPIPCLHVTPPPPPRHSARAAAVSPADSDDEVPIPRFSHHPALVSCCGSSPAPKCFPPLKPPPPLLLFALNLPRRLAAAADALSVMVHTNLCLRLLVPWVPRYHMTWDPEDTTGFMIRLTKFALVCTGAPYCCVLTVLRLWFYRPLLCTR